MQPTDEQRDIQALFVGGDTMVVDAGAGTGKTSTLQLCAFSTQRRGHYLAFNKAIVQDVAAKMPERCAASTAHSLAFRAVGRPYRPRLNAPRMKSFELAQRLSVQPINVRYGKESKWLSEGYLAGLVMRSITRFCQTADLEPTMEHVPYIDGIDIPDALGRKTWENNQMVREKLAPALVKAWADVTNVGGQLPFRHDHYLKIWHLSAPVIPTDFIMLDEAQDLNPVLAAIVGAQDHAQRVYVGDENQAIYEWTGAINAMAGFESDQRRKLTQSFRFGPEIAARANAILGRLDSTLRVRGLASIESTVGPLAEPDAILCRTNAVAMRSLLTAKTKGLHPHLVGGGTELAQFARAANDLKAGQWTSHADLACFTTWGEVEEYVQNDAQGDELRLLVDLIEDFGADVVIEALDQMPLEADADLIVSTAHKAKGREWDRVQLAEDFALVEESRPELRLRYVAMTRARLQLDDSVLSKAAEMTRRALDALGDQR